MSWNAPVNGDWTTAKLDQPPYVGGVMTLSHEEVLFVWETTEQFRVQKPWDDFYIVSQYNIFVEWLKAINGDTYNVIKMYDFEVDNLGIDANGIVKDTPIEEE